MREQTSKKILKTTIIILNLVLLFTISVNVNGTLTGADDAQKEREAVAYQINPETTSYNMGGSLVWGELKPGEKNIPSAIKDYQYPINPSTLSSQSQKVTLQVESTDLVHEEDNDFRIPASSIKITNSRPFNKANKVVNLDNQKTKQIPWMRNITPPSEQRIKEDLSFYISLPSGGLKAGNYNGEITIRYKPA